MQNKTEQKNGDSNHVTRRNLLKSSECARRCIMVDNNLANN